MLFADGELVFIRILRERIGFIRERQGPIIIKLEPISSEVALQLP